MLKQMILDIYKQIYARQPALFGSEHSYSLSPLSSLMAELFDSFQHQDVLECLHLLGSQNLDNYG